MIIAAQSFKIVGTLQTLSCFYSIQAIKNETISQNYASIAFYCRKH
ncbi:MAG: hypothetical protein RLZ95_1719 [Bacteroidota bacterium]|jgi:hypothetical protein